MQVLNGSAVLALAITMSLKEKFSQKCEALILWKIITQFLVQQNGTGCQGPGTRYAHNFIAILRGVNCMPVQEGPLFFRGTNVLHSSSIVRNEDE